MTQSTFEFSSGICKPDADGRYRGNFFYCHPDSDGISEAEAIRQWLCGCQDLSVSSPDWNYIERLCEIAEAQL